MVETAYNIITIGDIGVGKTSIIVRYNENKFSEFILSSIGFSKVFKDIVLKNGEKIKLIICDTSGQERYASLNKSYLRNIDAVLFVFDLNNRKTLFNINFSI